MRTPIKGTILNAVILNNIIYGNVYGHPDYDDGTEIHTSSIVSNEGPIYHTKNSIYLVVLYKAASTDEPPKTVLSLEQMCYIKLVEELAETIQAACKALRFGSAEVGPKFTQSNAERTIAEFEDATIAMAALGSVSPIVWDACESSVMLSGSPANQAELKKRQDRIINYFEYSKSVGVLDRDADLSKLFGH